MSSFTINDIRLTIDPLGIDIREHSFNKSFPLANYDKSIVKKTGRAIFSAKIDLVFAGASHNEDVNTYSDLAKLLHEMNTFPIVTIECQDFDGLVPKFGDGSTHAFGVQSVSVSSGNAQDIDDALFVTLELLLFNYLPYGDTFRWVARHDRDQLSSFRGFYQGWGLAYRDLTKPMTLSGIYNASVSDYDYVPGKYGFKLTNEVMTYNLPEGSLTGQTGKPVFREYFEDFLAADLGKRLIVRSSTNEVTLKRKDYRQISIASLEDTREELQKKVKPLSYVGKYINYQATNSKDQSPEFSSNYEAQFVKFALAFEKEFGKKLPVSSMYRSYKYQDEKYKEERSRPDLPRLHNEADKSFHCAGLAFDVLLEYGIEKNGKYVNTSEILDSFDKALVTNPENLILALKKGATDLAEGIVAVFKSKGGRIAPEEWNRFIRLAKDHGFIQAGPEKSYGSKEAWHFQVNNFKGKSLDYYINLAKLNDQIESPKLTIENSKAIINLIVDNKNEFVGIIPQLENANSDSQDSIVLNALNSEYDEIYGRASELFERRQVEKYLGDYGLTPENWEVVSPYGRTHLVMDVTKKIFPDGLDDSSFYLHSINYLQTFNLAPIPLSGMQYPTLQFFGGSNIAGAMSFITSPEGKNEFRNLLNFFRDDRKNVQLDPEMGMLSGIEIEEPISRLMDVNKIVFDDVSLQTIQANSEQATITFTAIPDKIDRELFVGSKRVSSDKCDTDLIEWFFRNIKLRGTKKTVIVEDYKLYETLLPGFNPVKTKGQYLSIKHDFGDYLSNWKTGFISNIINYIYDEGIYKDATDGIFKALDLEDESTRNFYNESPTDDYKKSTTRKWLFAREGIKDLIVEFAESLYVSEKDEYQTTEVKTILNDYYESLTTVNTTPLYNMKLPPNPISGLSVDTNPSFLIQDSREAGVISSMQRALKQAEKEASRQEEDFEEKAFGFGNEAKLFSFAAPFVPQKKTTEDGAVTRANKLSKDIAGLFDDPSLIPFEGAKSPRETTTGNSAKISSDLSSDTPITVNTDVRESTTRGKMLQEILTQGVKNQVYDNEKAAYLGMLSDKGSIEAASPPDGKFKLENIYGAEGLKKGLESFIRESGGKYGFGNAFPGAQVIVIDEFITGNILWGADKGARDSSYAPKVETDRFLLQNVVSIRKTESREEPASLAVIQIVNIDNQLITGDIQGGFAKDDGQAWKQYLAAKSKAGYIYDKFNKKIFGPGMSIQIKIGTTNNVNDIEPTFNGKIVSIENQDGIVTIVAQSHATELVAQEYGYVFKDYDFAGEADTDEILSTIMTQPEMSHFGRWNLSDVALPLIGSLDPSLGETKIRWSLVNRVNDDNISVQPLENYWNYFDNSWTNWGSKLKFVFFKQTGWDVIKEMELRHPGWIGHPVPYEDRMTLFFGVPDSNYFYKDIPPYFASKYLSRKPSTTTDLGLLTKAITTSFGEAAMDIHGGLLDFMNSNFGAVGSIITYGWAPSLTAPLSLILGTFYLGASIVGGLAAQGIGNTLKDYLSINAGEEDMKLDWLVTWRQLEQITKQPIDLTEDQLKTFTKPFRNHHIASDKLNIIDNKIRPDAKGHYNAIEMYYVDNPSDNSNITMEGELSLENFSGGTHYVALDPDCPSELRSTKICGSHNCQGLDMAKRYAVTELWRETKKHYSGNLLLLGDAAIKPYDIIHIFDTVNNIIGPVEVRSTVLTWDIKNGYTVDIVPDMCSSVNEISTLGFITGASICFSSMYPVITKWVANTWEESTDITKLSIFGGSAAGIAAGASLGGVLFGVAAVALGIAGLAIAAVKIVRATTSRYPLIIHPLLKNGEPYVSGLSTSYPKGIIEWVEGKWEEWIDDMEDGYADVQAQVNDFFTAVSSASAQVGNKE